MIRLGLDISNDFISRMNRRTTEIITNVYDDIDAVLPNWSDSSEKINPPEQKAEVKYNVSQNYIPYFNNKSILVNTVYTDYTYPNYSIYEH